MTNYYVNPDIGNDSNDGTVNDAGHAWATLDHALDSGSGVAAGDTVYCVHGSGNDETPSAESVVSVAGNKTGGWISVIGVNSSLQDDGTRYILDGGSLAGGASLLYISSSGNVYIYFKNLEFNHAKDEAIEFGGSYPKIMIFENCVLHGSTNEGVGNYAQAVLWLRCQFTGNGAEGVYRPWMSLFVFCVFSHNTGDGVQEYHNQSMFFGCIFHGNGGNGHFIEGGASNSRFHIHNIYDGNTADGLQEDGTTTPPFHVVLGCRFTNNAIGLDEDDDDIICTELYNFFLNNSTNTKTGTFTPASGTGDLTAGTEGYTDRTNHDFNLTDSATLRRTAINLGSF